jgi:hypothetical protein
MSEKGAIKKSTAQAICDAVKVKEGTTEGVPFKDVAERILALPTASGENKFAQFVEGTLTEITAEDLEGVTKIHNYAFYYNRSIEAVSFPSTLTTIGENAFKDSSLTSIGSFPSALTTIENQAFQGTRIKGSLIIPNTVTKIGTYAFSSNGDITSVIVGNGISRIEQSTFNFCNSLVDVSLPNTLTFIGNSAFNNCYQLKSLIIPASVTNIEPYALCIGNTATTRKATITFLSTIPHTISATTFDAKKINKIIVPKGCGEAYKTATNWANFADYIEESAE